MSRYTPTRTAGRPDTHEMVLVHRVFRRAFGELPGLVRDVPAGDVSRANVVVGALTEMTNALHHHHTAEDDLLWPVLLDRISTDAAFVLRMEEQHERIGQGLDRIAGLASRFAAAARPDDGERLATAVERTGAALCEHLDDEEHLVLPLVEEHITVAEWTLLAERGRAGIPRNRLLVQLGYILAECAPDEARAFLAEMPLTARILWRVVGRRAFTRERALVTAAATPDVPAALT